MEDNKIIIDLQVNNTQQVQNFNTQITSVTQNVTKVNSQVNNLNITLKKNKDEFDKSSTSIIDMIKKTEVLGSTIGDGVNAYKQAKSGISKLSKEFKSSAGSMSFAQKATKLFNAALKSNPIGFVVGLLVKLGQMFFKTEKGAKVLRTATNFLSNVFSGLVDIIKNYVIKYFQTLRTIAGAIGKVFKGDFKGALNDAKGAVQDFAENVTDSAKRLKNLGKDALDAAKNINTLRDNLNKLVTDEKELEKQRAERGIDDDRLQRIIDDEKKSYKERLEAAEQQNELRKKLNAEELRIAQERVNNQEGLLGTVSDEEKEALADEIHEGQIRVFELEREQASIAASYSDLVADIKQQQTDAIKNQNQKNREKAEAEKQKREAAKQEAQALIDEAIAAKEEFNFGDLSEKAKTDEIARINAQYKKLIDLGKQHSIDVKALEEKKNAELLLIDDVFAKEREEHQFDAQNLGKQKQKEQEKAEALRKINADYAIKTEQEKQDIVNEFYESSFTDFQQFLVKKHEEEIEQHKLALQKIDDDEKKTALAKAERDAANRQAAKDLAIQTYEAIFEFGRINREKELLDLDRQKQAELALAGDNAKAKERINKKFAAEEKRIKTEQAKTDKQKTLFEIALSTAKAVAAALPNFILAAIVGAQGALQAALVAAKPIPKFKRGGLLQGPSHEAGGIPFNIDGRGGFEAEGGEILLTKGVAQNPFLRARASELNVAAGGVPIPGAIGSKFALGGLLPPQALIPQPFRNNQSNAGIDVESFTSSLANKINSREVVLPVEHLHSVSTTVRLQESENSF